MTIETKTYHFWYSRKREIQDYVLLAQAMEFGHVSTLDIPRHNECEIVIAGEKIRLRFNLSSDVRDCYEKGTGKCEVGWDDLVYLGEGQYAALQSMNDVTEIVERMKELGCMIIPSVLLRAH